MRLRSLRIVSAMCGVLLSMCAYAVPIDVTSYEVSAPVAITSLDLSDTVVTDSDFVVTAPYVVTLDVATHVPIKQKSLALLEARTQSVNFAVMQNTNFERTPSY